MPRTTEQCHTVHHVITMYLAQARRDLSLRSYGTVACILRRFDAACGRLTLAECRPFDLQCWLNDHPEYRSEWYLRCVVSTIKRAFNWACEMELIQRNPFAKLRRRGRTQRLQPMTDEEFQTLLRGSDPTFRRFLIFLKFTGARPGEAASMRWGDVDFEQAAVVLKEHKTARKTGQARIIPLVPAVIKLLQWIQRQSPNTRGQDHVFVNRRGNAFSRGLLSLKMQRLRRRPGLPEYVTLQLCRRCCHLRGLRSFALTNAGPVFASLVVNTTVDSIAPGAGLLSLREAVGFADNDRAGNAKITFDKHVFATAQTINLTSGQLELSNTSETEKIIGPAAGVTISGGGLSRVLQVDANVQASISGLTITGGSTTGNGGGLTNYGTTTLTNCTVSGNLSGNTGGGIYNGATLTVSNCVFSGNSAPGGGAVGDVGVLKVTGSTFTNNSATVNSGAIDCNYYLDYSTVTDCIFTDNNAPYGGAINNGGTMSVAGSTFSGNMATTGGGAIDTNAYTLTITGCTLNNNSAPVGGAILNNLGGNLAISSSTIVSNSATYIGGGIDNTGPLTLTNCTLSGNTAGNGGGGLYNSSTAMLTNCTVNGNSAFIGGGVQSTGTLTVTHSSFSGNSTTGGEGGAILGIGGTTLVTNSAFTANSANQDGGALRNDAGQMAVNDSTFNGNLANGYGGAIYNGGYFAFGGTLTVTDCTLSDNSANGGGGAISNDRSGVATVSSSTFSSNSAGFAGGGLFDGNFTGVATLTVTNCKISGNTAGQLGGGLCDFLRHGHADQLHRQRRLCRQSRRRRVRQRRVAGPDLLRHQREHR
jgi:integrase